jgi:hypothetical protein
LITENNGDVSPEDLYITTDNTHKRQASIPPAGFEHAIPANERQQTHTLDLMATGTDCVYLTIQI